MYRKNHNGQLSIKEFHVPFCGTLDPDNRWVLLAELIPWQELEEAYAPQFSANVGAPAKPVRLAFGSLYIKQRLGLTDEETVLQIQENAYMQFFLGFSGYSSKVPFDTSMMVHFRKRFSDEDLRHINELVVQRGKEMLIDAAASQSHDDDDSSGEDQDDGDQLSLDSLIKPADWPEGKNWGTLSIDASCTPADITYPTDLKLLNEARQTTERVIDDLCKQANGYGAHRPRYDRGKARAHFLNVAKQKRPRRRRLKAAVRRQLSYLQRNLEAIDALIADGAGLSALKKHWWHKLLTCSDLHRQQGCLKVRLRRAGRRRHPSQRQHSLDVVGQLPQSLADRAVARAPQQVHDDRSQEGEHRGTDSVGIAMRVLTELGIAGPVPFVLNAPALPHQSQQGFWGSPDAGEEEVSPDVALALAGQRVGDHLHDPGTARPVGRDVLRCLPGLELPGGVAAMLLLLIRCRERDLPFSLELAADLAVEGLLVRFDG
jgi:hypothetical protein